MNTLFELRTDGDMRREAVAENQRLIHLALIDKGPWPLSQRQRRILEQLRGRQGRNVAMTIDELQQKVGSDARAIKADVRELVMSFRLPIVASRDGETGGYYFATTAQERVDGSEHYIREGVKLFARAAILRNEYDLNRLMGQHGLDLRQAMKEPTE
jgi:hypothetical protein